MSEVCDKKFKPNGELSESADVFLIRLEDYREEMQKDFEERINSLKYIYPLGFKLNIKAIQDRLKRVSMRTLNILKPYVRVSRKPINNYTSFSKNKLLFGRT
jgi:hypothetical protein